MGCTASKLDNEATVRRSKERRRLMKEAVHARHHLAAALSDYRRSLRFTGSALSSFAADEPISVSEHTPAVFLHPSPTPQPNHILPRVPPSPSASSIHPPPPPPLLSPTVASSKPPHIVSSSSNRRRRKDPPKLPHILSESSLPSTPGSDRSNFMPNFFPTAYQNSTYPTTPSQASSAWNWENFYPPSPPDSEFFSRKVQDRQQNQQNDYHLSHDVVDDEETERSEYDFFQARKEKQFESMNSTVDEETQREAVQNSECDDHDFSSKTSSSDDVVEEYDGDYLSEIGTRSDLGSSMRTDTVGQHQNSWEMQAYDEARQWKYGKSDDATNSSESYKGGREIAEINMVVRHKDLKEIVDAIKENFEKAAAAGDLVSQMLEIGGAQLDRSFSQLKKTVYHSSSVLSSLSSSWTSKPPLAVRYRLDTTALDQHGSPKSLCSTLDRLLAWEKKLYDEIKGREGVKIEHEKKLAQLQSQEYKGGDDLKLHKTKASITRLQSLIIVTSQAVTTTSTAIVCLRDSDLVPQLIELCHGFMYMWKSMYQYHEIQNNIVQQVRGFVNRSNKGDSTSELHRQATQDLESAITSWNSSFCRLMKFQKDFICAIHGWFKLSLVPVSGDNVDGTNKEPTAVYAFCDEWKLALDRVPDTVASEAIKSFINVVHVISVKQSEELKIKKRTESASKELEKKASSLRNIERKYYQSYSMVGIAPPISGSTNEHVLDTNDPLAEKKLELAACQRRVEEEMLRHSKAIEVTRAMTLNNLQSALPGVFQALTSFSGLYTEALEGVCICSYSIK